MNGSDYEVLKFMNNAPVKTLSYQEVLNVFSLYQKISVEKENGPSPTYSAAMGIEKKVSRKWTKVEIEAIIEGIQIFGVGKWSSIRKCFSEVFDENERTRLDIENKWNEMVDKAKYTRIEVNSSDDDQKT